jgi:hypothetical protein
MIVLLMQRSWMLFWALADKQMSMKMMMMISTLKIVMEPMTIQLIKKKKKKILTNQNTKV